MGFRSAAQRLAHLCGLHVTRYWRSTGSTSLHSHGSLIASQGIDLVVDVGANVGQFAQSIRRQGYQGKILSFEPQSVAYAELVRRAAADPSWSVAPRMALGAHRGEATLHLSRDSWSSSLLDVAEACLAAAPNAACVGTEPVAVARLDDFVDLIGDQQRLLLKMDTQGFEGQILDGATGVMDRIAGVLLELNVTTIYHGQADWLDLLNRLESFGFVVWHLTPIFHNRHTGQLLSIDALLFRPREQQSPR